MEAGLKKSNLNINIRIYDDKSTDYTIEYLKKIYFFANEIKIREKNVKADKNMYLIHKDFLRTDDDILVQLDSDMVISNDFFDIIKKIVYNVEVSKNSIYSLYNSINHETLRKIKYIENEKFYEKKHIGGACVIFTREIIEKIVKSFDIEMTDMKGYDWKWSKILYDMKIPIYVSEKSYVQHIGLGGQNNKEVRNLDIGKNYVGDIIPELNIFLINYYEKIIYLQHKEIQLLIKQNKKRKNIIQKIINKVKKIVKGF